jgi:hypothetical protein
MDIANGLRLLAENGWLAAMPEAFRDAMLRLCELQEFNAGDTVYLAGDPPPAASTASAMGRWG